MYNTNSLKMYKTNSLTKPQILITQKLYYTIS